MTCDTAGDLPYAVSERILLVYCGSYLLQYCTCRAVRTTYCTVLHCTVLYLSELGRWSGHREALWTDKLTSTVHVHVPPPRHTTQHSKAHYCTCTVRLPTVQYSAV